MSGTEEYLNLWGELFEQARSIDDYNAWRMENEDKVEALVLDILDNMDAMAIRYWLESCGWSYVEISRAYPDHFDRMLGMTIEYRLRPPFYHSCPMDSVVDMIRLQVWSGMYEQYRLGKTESSSS